MNPLATNWVNSIPIPVCDITPITIPALAHALLTTRVLRIPMTIASVKVFQEISRLVVLPTSATGSTESNPHKAA